DEVITGILGATGYDHPSDTGNITQDVEIRCECANDVLGFNHYEAVEFGFAVKGRPNAKGVQQTGFRCRFGGGQRREVQFDGVVAVTTHQNAALGVKANRLSSSADPFSPQHMRRSECCVPAKWEFRVGCKPTEFIALIDRPHEGCGG